MEDRSLPKPRVEPLISVPVSAIVELVSNRSEAEVLLSVGELAHDFDHVTAYLVRWIEHQQYLKACSSLSGGTQLSSLSPLICQARTVHRRGVMVLQQRITECLQKLQRHKDAVLMFANQNASFAQELRLCGLGARADQRLRLARTESALASRLSKFLSGCDSFYDEQPLALAIQHQADATARSAQAALSSYPPSLPEASKHQRHDTNKIDRTSCKDNLVSSVPITDVATESSASRKRPRPSGGNRECDKNGGTRRYESGDRGQMDSASSPEKGFADAEQSGHNKCAPGVEHAGPDREGGVCNGHGTQDHDGAAVGTHGPGTSRGLDQQQTDEPHDDEAVAPAFLTPPAIPAVAATVAGVTCGGNGGVPVLGLVAPLSASSSIGSTPSNGSLSPALVIASPAQDGWGRSVVTRYRRGEGVTVACVSSGNFRQTHGGDGRCSGRGGLEEGIYQGKEEVGQSSQSPSPTPPSTREPSPPPLSTQEGSSTVDGDRNEDDGAVYVDSDGLHQQEKGKSETVGAAGAMRGDDIGRHPALKIVGSAVGFLGGSEPEEGAASSGARPALKAASSAPGLDLPERAPHDADLGGADNKMLEEVLSSTRCGVSIRQCGQKGDEVQVQDAPSESEAEPSEGDEDRVDSAVTVEDPIGSVSASAALSETVVGETR